MDGYADMVGFNIHYQLMSLTYRICFISLPIPVTGPEGRSKFLVLSWELAFYEISVASQNHVEVVIFPLWKNCHMRF